ncbi:hypothetical protein D3C81_1527430 [compost metagenome]
MACSTASPAAWPCWSLTCLKKSMSAMPMVIGWPERFERAAVRTASISKARRLGSWVRGSLRAMRCNCCQRAAFCCSMASSRRWSMKKAPMKFSSSRVPRSMALSTMGSIVPSRWRMAKWRLWPSTLDFL